MDRELNTTPGEINHQRGTKNGSCSRDLISRNSANLETVITVTANEMRDSYEKSNGSLLNQAIPAENGVNMKRVEDNCSSCVIDVKCDDGGSTVQFVGAENQRVCRICHLSVKEIGGALMELMELGCGCKGELGSAHTHCAEAWFKVRGIRLCEICGEVAKNITGVSDSRFLEEWNENRFVDRERSNSLQGQPLCTFFMACLVIAFVLPLIFRVNIF